MIQVDLDRTADTCRFFDCISTLEDLVMEMKEGSFTTLLTASGQYDCFASRSTDLLCRTLIEFVLEIDSRSPFFL